MILTKIQYNIFLNAVPWKYSTYATWVIVIHSLLGITGGSLLLFIFEATGRNGNMIFLFLVGSLGLLFSLLNVIGMIIALKAHRTISQILLLSVYTIGSIFSAWLFILVFIATGINVIALFNPLGMFIVFFVFSGWYTFVLLGITRYKFLTKNQGNICYACSRTYKVTEQFCEDCGRLLVRGLLDSGKIMGKQENQTI